MHYRSVCTSLLVVLAVIGVNAIEPQGSQSIVSNGKPHSAQDLTFNQFLATPEEETKRKQVNLEKKGENENEPDENEPDENERDEHEGSPAKANKGSSKGKETAAAASSSAQAAKPTSGEKHDDELKNGKASSSVSNSAPAPLATTAAAATMISSAPAPAKPTPAPAAATSAAPAISIAPISLESLSFPEPPKAPATVSGKPNAAAATGPAASRGLAHRKKASAATLNPTPALCLTLLVMLAWF